MAEGANLSRIIRILFVVAAVLAITLGLRALQTVVTQLIVAALITITTAPLIGWFERRRVPHVLAVILTIAVIVIVLVLVIVFVAASLARMVLELPTYADSLAQFKQSVIDGLSNAGIDTSGIADASVFDPSLLINFATALLQSIVSILGSSWMLVLACAFMLFDSAGFGRRLRFALGAQSLTARQFFHWGSEVRSYLFITTWMAAVVAALDTVFLWAIGIPYPLVWGFLAFVMAYIPNVGFIIGMIPPTLLGFAQGGWSMALLIVAVYLLINTVSDEIIKPRIYQGGLDIAPSVSFISLLYWGFALGPVGAILALPMTLFVKTVVLGSDPATVHAAVLLGAQDPSDDVSSAPVAEASPA
jgi:AI-2 transport protein TqsA